MPYGIRRKSIRDPMNNVERRQVELKKELDDLMVEITEEAISVRIDYETSGSNMDSGSIVAIHQSSPLLDNEKEPLGDRLNPHLSNPNFSVPILGYEGREFPLFTQIQIQTIEFCNLKCDFCPNHYLIWDRLDDKKKGIPYNLMSIENYTKLMKNLSDLNFTGRVSPYLMNEPLMDKDRMVELISITRKYLPNSPIKLNSNGTGVTTELIGDMIDAGLTSMLFDDYFNDEYTYKLMDKLKPFSGENGKCHITISSNYNVRQVKKKGEDVGHHFGPHAFWNRAGLTNVNPDMPVPQKDCGYPSSQMYIKWNGDALLCCCDWEYEVIHGNVFDERIEEVWMNGSYFHYRDTLKEGRRDKLEMCRRCNKGAFPNEEERLKHLEEWIKNE